MEKASVEKIFSMLYARRLTFYSIFFCFLSSLLLILSHPPYHLWFLAWFALAPFFYVLEGKTFRERFALGYLFGVFYCFGMFWWFIHVTLPGMILLNLFLALYFALFAGTYALILKKSLITRTFLIACGWVVWEFARSRLLSGFGWAALGHTQYQQIALIQIADITGVYGVSFVLVVVNYLFYAAVRYRREMPVDKNALARLVLTVIFLLGAVLIYGFFVISSEGKGVGKALRVALIQPNIAQSRKWDPAWRMDILDQLKILSMEAAKEQPDVIVWPESALPAAPYRLAEDMEHAQETATRWSRPLLLGYVRRDGQLYYNTAGLISSNGVLKQQYDKLHLVPFGEFIPLRRIFPFLSSIVPIDDITPGKDQVVFMINGERGRFKIAVVICFEDTVDSVPRRLADAGAEILVNMTNDAWFHDTKAPWLHLQAAVLQAVSYKRPLVRSANTGVSAVVSPYGKIQRVVHSHDGKATFRAGFLVADVIPEARKTWRMILGDVFAYLCIATLLANVIISIINIILKKYENRGI